jgi:hypothetical protein
MEPSAAVVSEALQSAGHAGSCQTASLVDDVMAGPAGSCHSALLIDGVLENIMLWAGQWDRMKVAALVCQQWRTAANQVLQSAAVERAA